MSWIKRRPAATVEDLSHRLAANWTGTVQLARGAGGTVTLSAWNLLHAEGATGAVEVLALSDPLRPPFLLYGSKTYRGSDVRINRDGTVQIMEVAEILDHFYLTYVAKGGA